MQSEENKTVQKIGENAGFIFAYLLFTNILYFLLVFLNKIPTGWGFFHILGVTLFVVLAGLIIKRLLK